MPTARELDSCLRRNDVTPAQAEGMTEGMTDLSWGDEELCSLVRSLDGVYPERSRMGSGRLRRIAALPSALAMTFFE